MNEELKKLYKRILEILEEPNLNEGNIENEMENLEKTLDDFLKDMLDSEPFNAERNEIRNFVIEAQELREDKDLIDYILNISFLFYDFYLIILRFILEKPFNLFLKIS